MVPKLLLNFFCSAFQSEEVKVKEEVGRFLAYIRHSAFNLNNFQLNSNLIQILKIIHVHADLEEDFHLYLEARWTVFSSLLYLARYVTYRVIHC